MAISSVVIDQARMGDPVQPGAEWHAVILIARQPFDDPHKHVAGQFFSSLGIIYSEEKIPIDAVHIAVVQLAQRCLAALLRSTDQLPVLASAECGLRFPRLARDAVEK